MTGLQVGSPLQVLVKSVSGDGRVFNVTADIEEVQSTVVRFYSMLQYVEGI